MNNLDIEREAKKIEEEQMEFDFYHHTQMLRDAEMTGWHELITSPSKETRRNSSEAP